MCRLYELRMNRVWGSAARETPYPLHESLSRIVFRRISLNVTEWRRKICKIIHPRLLNYRANDVLVGLIFCFSIFTLISSLLMTHSITFAIFFVRKRSRIYPERRFSERSTTIHSMLLVIPVRYLNRRCRTIMFLRRKVRQSILRETWSWHVLLLLSQTRNLLYTTRSMITCCKDFRNSRDRPFVSVCPSGRGFRCSNIEVRNAGSCCSCDENNCIYHHWPHFGSSRWNR